MLSPKAPICTGRRLNRTSSGKRVVLGYGDCSIPALCLLATILAWPWGLATFLIYPLQVCRLTLRGRGAMSERAWLSLFNVMARFPEALGQLIFLSNRIRGTPSPPD